MFVNAIGHNYCHNKDFFINRPNGLNQYLLLIIKSKAVFVFGNKEERVNPYSLILFNKATPQYFRAADELYVNDWLTFTLSPEEEKFFINKSIPLDTIVESDKVYSCSEIIKFMQEEHCSVNANKSETIELLFKILYNKLKEIFECSGQVRPYYNQILSLRTKIYNNPSAEYSIDGLANSLNLSKSYFQHLYKIYCGISPISDVINSRIEFAKQLLNGTNYSIKEISEILGYPNDTQFIRQFKQTVGITANQYRKHCL